MQLFRASALLSLMSLIPNMGFSSQLKLNDFLKEVEKNNQSMTASKLISEGAEERSNEGKLIFKPIVFAQWQTVIDKKPTANINTQGDRTDNSFIVAGLSQQFNFGLQSKLSYRFAHTQIYNASPTFVPFNNFYDGTATLELSQSLWRNFWGIENRSQEQILISQALASKHAENFKMKAIIAQAESLYWSLSQIRKVVKVQKESLERAQKIRSWNQNRMQSGLAENSDFLQSDANYKAREFEVKASTQDLKTIQRSFNSFRGNDSDVLDEDLESVDSAKIKRLALPQKEELREDTKAALELRNISKASADLSVEKNKPVFEIYGAYALNGRDIDSVKANNNTFKTDHNTTAIGVRFVTPLDFINNMNNINGYRKEQIAAEQNYSRKLFEQEQQWNDLSSRFEDAKVRLSLVEKIEEAQKIKASNERVRLSKGRTVTFQVLNFEQDYAQSELARIQSETNILNIYAQLQTFSAGGSK